MKTPLKTSKTNASLGKLGTNRRGGLRRWSFFCVVTMLGSVFVISAFGLANHVWAVSTRSFSIDSASDFNAGKVEGTSVDSRGHVVAGVAVKRTELGGPVAFGLANYQGDTLVGVGEPARLLRVKKDRVDTVGEFQELAISALTVVDNVAYAATLPNGVVYKYAGGKLSQFAVPEPGTNIWQLLWSKKAKRLLAATGPKGKILSIDASGRVAEYADLEVDNIMSIAESPQGLLAGTDGLAQLYRFKSPGKGEIVYDFDGSEITSIAFAKGQIVLAANQIQGGSGSGTVMRLGADGVPEKLHSDGGTHFTRVVIAPDGAIYASGGAQGRIFRIDTEGHVRVWTDVEERQVVDMTFKGTTPVFLTSDAAALYHINPAAKTKHLWTSKVFDAGVVSRFGQLHWRGVGKIRFSTRSGNTEKPDESWAQWSSPLASPGPIRSAAGKYLQLRAELEKSAVLYAAEVFYLPINQRARITQVSLQNRDAQSKRYSLSWNVENPDGDSMRYWLRFRAESQSRWRDLLKPEEVVTSSSYSWDTSGIPDGYYVVEVRANDELSNSRPRTLHSKAESEPFLVDNHPPQIRQLKQQGKNVVGEAFDAMGPIAKLEYAVNGGQWRLFFPNDQLFDTRSEKFSIPLAGAGAKPIVAVRVTDKAGLTTSAEIEIK